MVSTPTTRLRLEKQALGENLNTWGNNRLNDALDRIDEAVGGVQAIAISGTATTLTSTNYATDQARKAAIVFTGTLSANSTVTVPGVEKVYLCVNNCTMGSYSLTIKTAAGSGVSLRSGPQSVYCDATSVYRATPTLAELPVPTSDLAMGGYKLTGLGTPSATTDATTKAYVDAAASSVNATGAAASATAAATSATAAATSATAAATSATAAASSATAAASSAASISGGPVASVNGQTGIVVLGSLVTGLNAGYETLTTTVPTLSDNNRTVTSTVTNQFQGGRSGTGRSSGKYYYEVKLGSPSTLFGIGVMTAAATMAALLGSASGAWAIQNTATDGYYSGSSTVVTTVGAFTPASGDIFGIAVDFSTGSFWAARNGTWLTGDPAAGTSPGLATVSGTVYPASIMFGTASAGLTMRLARHEFSYAPPTGFTAWAGEADAANSSPVLGGTTRVQGRLVRDVTALSANTLDLSLGQYFTRTINGATTFVFSNPPASGAFEFWLELTHTSGTAAWPASVTWPSAGAAPTLTAARTSLFKFMTANGGTRWRGMSWLDYTT